MNIWLIPTITTQSPEPLFFFSHRIWFRFFVSVWVDTWISFWFISTYHVPPSLPLCVTTQNKSKPGLCLYWFYTPGNKHLSRLFYTYFFLPLFTIVCVRTFARDTFILSFFSFIFFSELYVFFYSFFSEIHSQNSTQIHWFSIQILVMYISKV